MNPAVIRRPRQPQEQQRPSPPNPPDAGAAVEPAITAAQYALLTKRRSAGAFVRFQVAQGNPRFVRAEWDAIYAEYVNQ